MPSSESSKPQKARRARPHSGVVLFLAYALGPLAPLVLRRGRHNLTWTLLTLIGVLTWAGMAWRWTAVRAAVTTGTVALVPWMLGVAVATGVLVLATARGLWITGNAPSFASRTLPRWARQPRLCMLLGFPCPGFGHLVAGYPRRAAIASAIATSTFLPWLALWQAPWIWQCNRNAGTSAVPGLALEVVFLAAAALAGCGALGWIASSLDGARLQARALGHHAGMHGDRVALALLATWILTLLNLHPEQLARDLDRFAAPLQERGYRLVPLCLEWSAMRLDRAEPRYPMVSADLLDALGKREAAESLRSELHRRWESYAEQLLHEEANIGGFLYPPLISVSGESDSLPTWLIAPEPPAPEPAAPAPAAAPSDSTPAAAPAQPAGSDTTAAPQPAPPDTTKAKVAAPDSV